MMLKRASILAVLSAIALSGTLPAGDACGIVPAAEHACCAVASTHPADACCASDLAETDDPQLCDCVHPPTTPAVVTGESAQWSLTLETTLPPARLVTQDHTEWVGRPGVDARARSHPPPPAYLLHASFLT